MKFPKNRANLYVVVREDGALCGAFSEWEEAEDYRGACEQEFLDKTGKRALFYTRLVIYYG